jgi:hypothetical protein
VAIFLIVRIYILDGAAEAAVPELQPFLIQLSCMAHSSRLLQSASNRTDEGQQYYQSSKHVLFDIEP